MCIDPIVIKKIGKMFFYKATQYKSYYIHLQTRMHESSVLCKKKKKDLSLQPV